MAIKTELVQLKFTKEDHLKLKAIAKEHGSKITQYLYDSMKFYGAFDSAFLSQMNITAKKSGYTIPDLIQSLLQTYLAVDMAAIDVFGISLTFKQAFQVDDRGNRIRGAELNDKVYREALKKMQDFLERAIQASKKKKPLFIETEMAVIMSQIVSKQFINDQKAAVSS